MPTLVCVPIMVGEIASALEDAAAARDLGANLIEYRLDGCFEGAGDEGELRDAVRLVGESPLPCIATCRPAWEGGEYDGAEDARLGLFEALAGSDRPPRYIDVERAALDRSPDARARIEAIPKRDGDGPGLILSIHDFQGRPADLTRRVTAAWAEPAASVVKVAYRARSLRDNLELFELLRESPTPMIALGMGEFGLMSRVLAPKFGGFLTFASLRDATATAPGQPTVRELLDRYRFRLIGPATKVYGVIGWPVTHSMGPLIHNAGFEAVGHDGVYLPLPIAADENDPEGTSASFKATLHALLDDGRLAFAGASVTLPHKEALVRFFAALGDAPPDERSRLATRIGAANTLVVQGGPSIANTDATAIRSLLEERLHDLGEAHVVVVGAGGVARAAAYACASAGARVTIANRTHARAEALAQDLAGRLDAGARGSIAAGDLSSLPAPGTAFVNCTPVGMTGGPDPNGLSIPIPAGGALPPETIFFDTVYNPMETPMLKAAREHGFQIIDGVQMFVRQAAEQFTMWTGTPAPVRLFERIVREELVGGENREEERRE